MRIKKIVRATLIKLVRPLQRYFAALAEADLPQFANTPRNLIIELPWRIYDADRITIGDNVHLGPGALLVPQTHYPTEVMRDPGVQHVVQRFSSRITIGHRVTSTANLTLAAMQEITIEDDVMFASNVMISDGSHGYENADEPYKYQKMFKIAPVVIKRGCWIGQNVVIMPGVIIGELSIIGANSVVTKSVPSRCIAAGAPAKILKKWDSAARRWTPA